MPGGGPGAGTVPAPTPVDGARPGRLRRAWDFIKWPPPHQGPLFTRRSEAATYLGAWGMTLTHLVLWVLIAVGVLTGLGITIGNSVLSFLATALLIWIVIAAHRRLQIDHGGRTRHVIAAWWMGPWDSVGRVVWLPTRLPHAWHTLRRGPGTDGPDAPPGGAGGDNGP